MENSEEGIDDELWLKMRRITKWRIQKKGVMMNCGWRRSRAEGNQGRIGRVSMCLVWTRLSLPQHFDPIEARVSGLGD